MINKLDIVPALPPLDDFSPTPYGRWMPYNQSLTNATTMVQVQNFLPHKACAACIQVVSNCLVT